MKSVSKYEHKIAHFKRFTYLIKIVILFGIYFVTAKLGLSLDAVSRFATLVWLPSGIAVTSLLLFGYQLWPGIFLGAFLINLFTGASPIVAVAIGIGNTLEAITGTYLLKRIGFNITFENLFDVLKLLIVIPLCASVSATIGVTSLFLEHTVASKMYYPTWQAWWIGDMISILILTPLFLLWHTKPHISFQPKRIFEGILLAAVVIFVGLFVFRGLFGISIKNSATTYLVFPVLIWASLRFGQRGSILVAFALSVFAIVETIFGFSPFAIGRLSQRLLPLQSFLGVMTITAMILSVIDARRRKLEQRKDDFISLASHELKLPLTSMKAFVQLCKKILLERKDRKLVSHLTKVEGQIAKETRLINELLDASKIQAGKLEFQKKQILLTQLVHETVEIVQTTTHHHISIKSNQLKDSLSVYADYERLSQALANLLTNAIKYSPRAKNIIVTIGVKREEAVVSVKDFGIGMTEGQQKNIFQRYYRAHDNANKSYPGLGIGLYICREIIQRTNGKIWVKSRLHKGTTFYFSLPLYSK